MTHKHQAHNRPTHMHSGPAHDLIAGLFFAGRRRRVYQRLVELSGARPGQRVLDVGCGDGYLTRLIGPIVGPTGHVDGVDPSPDAVARARSLTPQPNCTYAIGDARALTAPDDTYDIVVTTLMLHHVDEGDRSKALREMRRVLRPSGQLLIAEFRPPTSPILRYAIRPLASPAMLHNPLELLEPLAHDAGLKPDSTGDLHPWIRYLHARKPGT